MGVFEELERVLVACSLVDMSGSRENLASRRDGLKTAATAAAAAAALVRPALSVVPLSVQLSRDNALRSSPPPPPPSVELHGDEWGLDGVADADADTDTNTDNGDRKRRADDSTGRHFKRPRADSPVAATTAPPTASTARLLPVVAPPSDRSAASFPFPLPCPPSSFSSLLCSESLPPELLSSAVCPLRPSELSAASVAALQSDYARLLDRCYALSCRSLQQRLDSSQLSLHSALQACCSEQTEACERCGCCCSAVAAVYEGCVGRLLAERVAVGRLSSSHRRLWFDLLERRVQQRDELIERLESERAMEREQWRNKQRSLEHEVSRLRVELQLHNAASNQSAGDVHVGMAH